MEQLNLKLPSKLLHLAQHYVDSQGYTNVQELIRESLREKLLTEEIKAEYISKLLEIEKSPNWLNIEESKAALFELGKKAQEFRASQNE